MVRFYSIFVAAFLALSLTACLADSNPPKTLPDDFIGHLWVDSSGVCAQLYFYRNGIIEARCDKKKNTLVQYSQYKIIHQSGPNDFYIAAADSSWKPFDKKNLQDRFFYRYERIWLKSEVAGKNNILRTENFREWPTEKEWVEFTPAQHWQKLQSTLKEIPDLVSSGSKHFRMD
jgi:hypothetical protein